MRGNGLILAINPGSTSTKIGLFAEDALRWSCNVRHGNEQMSEFAGRPMLDQFAFRLKEIEAELTRRIVAVNCLSAVVGRGGLLRPVASGTYRINQLMLDELRAAARGDHASNLGAPLAAALAAHSQCPAFIVDPVSVDEWPPVARLSGCAQLERPCLSHALNTKAVAKRFAREHGAGYPSLRLIVAHLGSGISVSAHEGGRMIDATNSREEGAFSTERSGTVPALKLLPPGGPFAVLARGDRRTDRAVPLQIQTQMQPHLALGLALAPPQTPIHPRQRLKQTAVLRQPASRSFGTRFGQGTHFPAQLTENCAQQFRIQHRLRLGKTTQAHRTTAHLLLDPLEFAGRTQTPHRAHHRIEQSH